VTLLLEHYLWRFRTCAVETAHFSIANFLRTTESATESCTRNWSDDYPDRKRWDLRVIGSSRKAPEYSRTGFFCQGRKRFARIEVVLRQCVPRCWSRDLTSPSMLAIKIVLAGGMSSQSSMRTLVHALLEYTTLQVRTRTLARGDRRRRRRCPDAIYQRLAEWVFLLTPRKKERRKDSCSSRAQRRMHAHENRTRGESERDVRSRCRAAPPKLPSLKEAR